MPLASTFALQFYGPVCAAMVSGIGAGELLVASPTKLVRAGVTAVGTGDAPLLRPYRMRNAGCSGVGTGAMLVASAKKSVRAGLTVYVSALSSDDVTGAVLEAKVNGDQSLKQTLNAILAAVTSGGGGSGGGLTVEQAAQLTAIQASTTSTAAAVAAQATKVTDLAEIHGLVPGSPLTVTATSRSAGGVTQTISESGGTVTVTRA